MSLSNKGGYGNENSKKAIGFMSIQCACKNIFAHTSCFLYISLLFLNMNTEKNFLILNLDTDL